MTPSRQFIGESSRVDVFQKSESEVVVDFVESANDGSRQRFFE
jgi:hypothetical protein